MNSVRGERLSANEQHRVVIVDDDPVIRELAYAVLSAEPDLAVVGQAADGIEAIAIVQRERPDVVVMDVDMPFLDGSRTTERILAINPDTKVLAFTGHTGGDIVVGMIVAGAVGFAVKGSDPRELVHAVRQAATRSMIVDPSAMPGLFSSLLDMARSERERRREVEELAESLESFLDDTIRALAAALHSRDGYTGAHDDRVAAMCVKVGMRLGIEGQDLRNLRLAGILHDIGKIGVPDHILHKTVPLTDDEWSVIRQHTIWGEKILEPVAELRPVAKIVRHSHEHWDGSGYPDQLVGVDIPLGARIVLACDAFDAITTKRTYQRAHTEEEAIAIVKRLTGLHFDPEVSGVLLA
ncbi:MAG: response regulator, partial [Thermoleophilia bacterium]|nr:response regulator [Thermoleophilia bacterium]